MQRRSLGLQTMLANSLLQYHDQPQGLLLTKNAELILGIQGMVTNMKVPL